MSSARHAYACALAGCMASLCLGILLFWVGHPAFIIFPTVLIATVCATFGFASNKDVISRLDKAAAKRLFFLTPTVFVALCTVRLYPYDEVIKTPHPFISSGGADGTLRCGHNTTINGDEFILWGNAWQVYMTSINGTTAHIIDVVVAPLVSSDARCTFDQPVYAACMGSTWDELHSCLHLQPAEQRYMRRFEPSEHVATIFEELAPAHTLFQIDPMSTSDTDAYAADLRLKGAWLWCRALCTYLLLAAISLGFCLWWVRGDGLDPADINTTLAYQHPLPQDTPAHTHQAHPLSAPLVCEPQPESSFSTPQPVPPPPLSVDEAAKKDPAPPPALEGGGGADVPPPVGVSVPQQSRMGMGVSDERKVALAMWCAATLVAGGVIGLCAWYHITGYPESHPGKVMIVIITAIFGGIACVVAAHASWGCLEWRGIENFDVTIPNLPLIYGFVVLLWASILMSQGPAMDDLRWAYHSLHIDLSAEPADMWCPSRGALPSAASIALRGGGWRAEWPQAPVAFSVGQWDVFAAPVNYTSPTGSGCAHQLGSFTAVCVVQSWEEAQQCISATGATEAQDPVGVRRIRAVPVGSDTVEGIGEKLVLARTFEFNTESHVDMKATVKRRMSSVKWLWGRAAISWVLSTLPLALFRPLRWVAQRLLLGALILVIGAGYVWQSVL